MTKVLLEIEFETDDEFFSLLANALCAFRRSKSAICETRVNDPDQLREILNDAKKAWYALLNAAEERLEKGCKEVTEMWYRKFRPRFIVGSDQK